MVLRLTNILLVIFLSCSSPGKQSSEQEKTQAGDNDKEVTCFVYHRFGDGRYPSTNVSIENFEAHLRHLKNNDFQVLTFKDAVNYLKNDEPKKPTAVITIDDGYTSFYKNGLPLLEKFGFPATLFINTETVGGNDYMNWEELKDAHSRGIEISNHTHSHQYFLNLPESERYTTFEEELQLTQNLIKKNLGEAPTTFAYPYGEFDPQMKELVKEMGFVAAAAQNSGIIHSGSDLMRCPRFPMSEYYADIEKFTSKASMHALKVRQEKPQSFILPENDPSPSLKIVFEKGTLALDQLQCFVQGSDCKTSINMNENGLELTVKATSDIRNQRRTLYTITIPDKQGNWHWFSHLWINAEVK